eukprot:jgi/Antlo1/93/1323
MRDMLNYAMWCFKSSFHNISSSHKARNKNFYWRVLSLDKYLSRESVEALKCNAEYFDDFLCLSRMLGFFRECGLRQNDPDRSDLNLCPRTTGALDLLTDKCAVMQCTFRKTRSCSAVKKGSSEAPPFLRIQFFRESGKEKYHGTRHTEYRIQSYRNPRDYAYNNHFYYSEPSEEDNLLRQGGMNSVPLANKRQEGVSDYISESHCIMQRIYDVEKSHLTGSHGISGLRRECKTASLCAHCGTTKTSLWRRLGDAVVCNACGLYHRMHGIKRPISLRKSFIRRRRKLLNTTEKCNGD